MAFTLNNVVPWGRSFDEYEAMFALSGKDLSKRILGCGDGPSSFNSTFTKRGGSVVSVDPIYCFNAEEIRNRIDETFKEVLEQTIKNKDEFVWRHIQSVEELGMMRMSTMNDFLSDYETGLRQGRYICSELPALPFKDGEFDIALSSHLLFLYSEQLSEDFHVNSLKELCRVATEARIFPLTELGAKRSRHLEAVIKRLADEGFPASIEKVSYEFQKGGNEMIRLTAV